MRAAWCALVAAAILACTAPRVGEDSAAACTNGFDDNGDGRVDCADPACVAGGFCEATLEACTNEVDDDGNGRVDCEDAGCIGGGFCEARASECTVDPQSGCPRGMVCSAKGIETTGSVCALPGTVELLRQCNEPGACRPGLHCFGYCRKICQTELDCPRETFCVRNARTKFGTCSVACIPALHGSGCPTPACVVPHVFEVRFDDFDLAGICADPVSWKGRVGEGGECEDPPSIARLDGMCADALVCFPHPDGSSRCRTTCGLTQQGEVVVKCANKAHRCGEAYPLDHRKPLENQLIMGICAP